MIAVKGPDSKEERIEHMVTLYQIPLLRMCIMYLHDEELAKDAVLWMKERKPSSPKQKKPEAGC